MKKINFSLLAILAAFVMINGCSKTPMEPQISSEKAKSSIQCEGNSVTWTGGDQMTVVTKYTPDDNGILTISNISLTRTNTFTTVASTVSHYSKQYPANPPMQTFNFTSSQRPYNVLKVCVSYDLQIIYAVEDFQGEGQFCYYIDSNFAGRHLITQY